MKASREQVTYSVSGVIETLLVKGTGAFPGVRPNANEIVDRVNVLTHYSLRLREPTDFYDPRLAMSALDKVAKEQTRKAQLVAVAAGVSTGLFGIPGMAIDLPVLVANTVGLVRRHALVYGFTSIEDSRDDPLPLLLALGASVGADMIIDRVGTQFAEKVGLDLGSKFVEKYLVQRISEQFAARLLTSWLPRVVPIIGTATIAALDTAFLTFAGRESMRHFRRRHLLVRQQITTFGVERAIWKGLAANQTNVLPGTETPALEPPPTEGHPNQNNTGLSQ